SFTEALDVALCYGWIDGQRRSFDEESFFQRFTPRRKKSIWSKINRAKAADLIKCGRMRPAGLAAIEAAKADGRWDAAYDSGRTAEVPEDLQAELDANPDAKAFFATVSSQNRYAILFRVQTAKKPETRAKRIKQFVGMLARKETLHP
ncbi:MAG: YdeI/OmpD-associated family protein, partial [Gemmatimonadota bacterium]|nr:YdeI/OmpD-associated family protein [Gemmatimonadota bacterium]